MKKEHVAPRELMALPQLINAVFGAFCLTAQLIADPAENYGVGWECWSVIRQIDGKLLEIGGNDQLPASEVTGRSLLGVATLALLLPPVSSVLQYL